VCVCVCERERERERGYVIKWIELGAFSILIFSIKNDFYEGLKCNLVRKENYCLILKVSGFLIKPWLKEEAI